MARRHLFFWGAFVIALILVSAGIPIESRGRAGGQDQVILATDNTITAGRNVNMVSGMTLPDGDPWLQRQNEPSLAVSTRNPLHILAGANDYRTVDMPESEGKLPGIVNGTPGDSWLGVYKSFDGGESWKSTLIPGYPQDKSAVGMASKIKGYEAGADPVVRAGNNGLFYYSGMAFNRTNTGGAVFVSRFIDNNNDEKGDPIKYLDTTIIDSQNGTRFKDKPWLAVDLPADSLKTVLIDGQAIPKANVYVVYTVFTGEGDTLQGKIMFSRSTNCGTTWERPVEISRGDLLNQGASICVDPRGNGFVYIVWRRFRKGDQTDAFIFASSRDWGRSFQKSIVPVATFAPGVLFDQPTAGDESSELPGTAFRSNAYPAMAVDKKGVVYIAWSQRGLAPANAARIVLTTGTNGWEWTPPVPIDNAPTVLGHQFMPSLAFAAAKVMAVWYDQRNDIAGQGGFFDWIFDDAGWWEWRHTLDIRAAMADPALSPTFGPSIQVSRYLYHLGRDDQDATKYKAYQAQFNPPNYPLFKGGLVPFVGDYIDIAASPTLVMTSDKKWRFNTEPSDTFAFHAAWTDNRDVRPPADHDWTLYSPTDYSHPDFGKGTAPCSGGGKAGMRDQNIYTARITKGVEAGTLANSKPLNLTVPRAFSIFVKNSTEDVRAFRLTIANQPAGGSASFLQFDALATLDAKIAPYSTISRQVFVQAPDPKASVRVDIAEIDAPGGAFIAGGLQSYVEINNDPTNPGTVGDGLQYKETHDPTIGAPTVSYWTVDPNSLNPEIINPNDINLDLINPDIVTPRIRNESLGVVDPNLMYSGALDLTSYATPRIRNADIINPRIRNTDVMAMSAEDNAVTDVEWTVKNDGNTASSYTFQTISKVPLPEGIYAQLLIYKVHYTPGLDENGCALQQTPHHELISNIINPRIRNPRIRNLNILTPDVVSADVENATFSVPPGGEVKVILRLFKPGEVTTQSAKGTQILGDTGDPLADFLEAVGVAATAQSVNSDQASEGETEPEAASSVLVIGTESALPDGVLGQAYSKPLTAVGGKEPYSWWVNPLALPPGLVLNGATGEILGVPQKDPARTVYPATYEFVVQVSDSSSPLQTDNQRYWITVKEPYVPPPALMITTSALPTGTVGAPYSSTLIAVGGVLPHRWMLASGALPDGLTLDSSGVVSGTPQTVGTFTFTAEVIDSATPTPQVASQTYTISISLMIYTISGRVLGGGQGMPGVVMRGLPNAPATDANGYYFDEVPAGWSGLVTPFLANYNITPASRPYADVATNLMNEDYGASVSIYTISGTIAQSGIPIAGVTLTGFGDPAPVTSTDGFYQAVVPHGWSGTVTPSKDKFTFNPASRTYTPVLANQLDQTYAAIPAPGADDAFEENDIRALAYPVIPSVLSDLRLWDDDWYQIVLGSGQALKVDVAGLTATDVNVEIYDATGRYLAGGISGKAVDTAYLAGVPAGTYYIKVPYTQSTGLQNSYSLSIQVNGFALGTLSGKVTDSTASGVPTRVVAGEPSGVYLYQTLADLNGDYRISLPSGYYLVWFDTTPQAPSYAGVNYAGEWFDNRSSSTGATLVEITAGQTRTDVNATLTAGGTISGQLTDSSGAPASSATVSVFRPNGVLVSSATTGGTGQYSVGRIPSGNYVVGFRPATGDDAAEFYADTSASTGADTVDVQAGQTTAGIDAILAKGGYISGRVTDAGGAGVENVRVDIYESSVKILVASALTDASGYYTVRGVPQGNLKAFFDARGTTAAYTSKWHNGKLSFAEAATIAVEAGQITAEINAQLARGGTVTGKVTDPAGNGLRQILVSVFDLGSHELGLTETDELGNYSLDRIPAGSVRVLFRPAGGTYAFEWHNNQGSYGVATAVTVVADQTTANINAQLAAGGTVAGRVTNAAGAGIPGVVVAAYDAALKFPVSYSLTGADGSYTVPRLATARYKIEFNADHTAYVTKWYREKTSYETASTVSVTAGSTTSGISTTLAARPLLALSTTTLPNGTVGLAYSAALQATGGSPYYRWSLVSGALPEGLTLSTTGIISGVPSRDGTFTFTPQVIDSSSPQQLDSRSFSITVAPTAVTTYTISGAVTSSGLPLAGVTITGLPAPPVTDAAGFYTATVSSGWSGTLTPTMPGYSFSPASRTYPSIVANQTNQDYAADPAPAYEDPFDPAGPGNDDMANAALISAGTLSNLRLLDDDWYRVVVAAGQDLRVSIQGFYPQDIDVEVYDSSGNLLIAGVSPREKETVYVSDLPAGTYYIRLGYLGGGSLQNIYSLTIEMGNLTIGDITGRLTGPDGNGVRARVEIYDPSGLNLFLGLSKSDGSYKVSLPAADYVLRFNALPVWPYFAGTNYLAEWYDDVPAAAGARVLTIRAGAVTSGINASLRPGGAIEGRVTDPQGSPVAFADVWAHQANGQLVTNQVRADANGYYRLERIPTGNYRLRFRTTLGDYAQEWSGNKSSFGDADPVPVQAGQTTAGIDVVFASGGAISGKVVDTAGNAVAGVGVEIYESAVEIGVGSVLTAADGTYAFNHVAAGSYKVYFNTANDPANHAAEWLNDKYAFSEASSITIAAGQTTPNVNAQLAVGGSISGKVTNSTGAGIANALAMAFDLSGHPLVSSSRTTDDLGAYKLDRLPPGNLRVRIRPGSGTLATEWYNNRASYGSADSVPVLAGQTSSAINLQLDAGGSITGRVTNASGVAIPKVLVVAYDSAYEFMVTSALTDAAGNYALTRIPTSSVKVFFNAEYTDYASVYYNNRAAFGSATLVSVTAGRATSGINAVLAAKAPLTIATASLPRGAVSSSYSAPLASSGGTPLLYWKILNGSLPNGLRLEGSGRITGTPTVQGTFAFTAQVSDTSVSQQTVSKGFIIVVDPYAGSNFLISGKVTLNGSALAGVTMNGLPNNPVTNVLGEYVDVVPPAWTGTVVPSLAGYGFTPGSMSYAGIAASLFNQDYAAAVARTISGTVTLGGAALEGVRLAGLPGEPRTDAAGFYAATVPDGWSGTVTPTLIGFSFNPATMSYAAVTYDRANQNYVGTAVTGTDDPYEENDDWNQAWAIALGTYQDLVLADADWFKVYVSAADAGKDLKIHIVGSAYSDPAARRDMDFKILDQSGRLLCWNVSGGDDETAYVPNVAAGWYYIGQDYVSVSPPGFEVYSLSAEVGTGFGIGYIKGKLTDDSSPTQAIANAYVEIMGEPFNWDICRTMVTTDAQGDYVIGFTPGKYRVQFNLTNNMHRDPQGLDVNYVGKEYSRVLTITAGATISGIDATLIKGGTITGRLTDAQGNGIPNRFVRAYSGNGNQASVGYTDQDGHYSIDHLRPGNYKVRFVPASPSECVPEWFGDALSADDGLPVPVQSGQTTPNVDAQLDHLWMAVQGFIEGRVTDASGNPINRAGITAYDSMGINIASAGTDNDGYYRLGGLVAGPVRLYVQSNDATPGYVNEYYPDKSTLAEAVPVMVTAGQTVAGINAQLAQGGAVSGRIMDSSGNGLYSINVLLVSVDSTRTYGATTSGVLGSYGTYTIPRVLPGSYKLLIRPHPGVYSAEWYSAKSSFATGDVITVTSGQTVTGLDARITASGGSLSGTVTNGSVGLADIQVQVLDGTKNVMFAGGMTGTDGTYSFPHIPAGPVKLLYNPDPNFLGYNSQYFSAKATYETADAVTITQGQATSDKNAILGQLAPPDIITTSLPDGVMARAYSAPLTAAGGRPFYGWALVSGSLPDGLILRTNGVISGTPMATGTSTFTVRVTDSTYPQKSDEKIFSITVGAFTGPGFAISGTVRLNGSALPGVVLNGLPGNPVTTNSGNYMAIVPAGWSGLVTPTLAGFAFDPPNRTYLTVTANMPAHDYAASAGHIISGTVKINGTPLPGVLMSGAPGNPRTDTNGFYAAAVPSGWSGAIIPTAPGFTFNPASVTYANVSSDWALQDYAATFQGGVDDASEENDTFASAREITPGVYTNLVANDEDWFKVYVSTANRGKDLKIHTEALAVPNPGTYYDLDFAVFSESGKMLGTVTNSSDDETLYLSGLAQGWYYIGVIYTGQVGTVYLMTAEIGSDFGIGYVSGQVTDAAGRGIENAFVELQYYGVSTDNRGPLVTTDGDGHFTLGHVPGQYRVLYNSTNLPAFNYPWAPNADYAGVSGDEVITINAGMTLSGFNAQLDQAGSISGRVTDANGNPLGATGGLFYAYDSNNRSVSFGWTNADGVYRIPHLVPGNYKVRFRNTTNAFSYEWYGNASTIEESLPVPVQAGATTTGIDARLENWTDVQGIIHGYVTDAAGNPLNGVTVTAYDSAGIAVNSGGTTWNGTGQYWIGRLRPGQYRLYFNAGNADGNRVSEYYADRPTLAEAIPVQVQAGQTTDQVDAQLADGGTISGRVTDSSGNGVTGAGVLIIARDGDRSYNATADVNGNYTRRNILPGPYRVRFNPGIGNFASEWHDDKTSFILGNDVVVSSGETVSGIDAEVEANGAFITGHVTNGAAGLKDVIVYARDSAKPNVSIMSTRTGPDGAYTLRRLPAGDAKVLFNADWNLLAYNSEFYNDKATFESANLVPTSLGQTTANIDAILAPVPAVTVTTTSLPDAQQTVFYSAYLQASGGRPFYAWSLESGALPDGLALNSNGEIRGTTTALGTFTFVARVIDSGRPQQAVTKAVALIVGAYSGQGHLVSGKVMAAGSPVPGVVINGLPGDPTTDALGGYSAVVPPGWSGTVTPILAGYAFTPPGRTYENVGANFPAQDYAATAGWTISGAITLNGTALPGVLMVGLPGEPRTDATGAYTASVPGGWSGTATPTLPGFTFSPATQTYSGVSAHTIGEDYTASYVGGVDDGFEPNDSYEAAAAITPGTTANLVRGWNEDWFRIYVPPADAGKILRIHVHTFAGSNANRYPGIGFIVVDGSRNLLSQHSGGLADEYAFIPDLAEGWYWIGLREAREQGIVYALSADIGPDFGLGFFEGRVTDDQDRPIEGVYVGISTAEVQGLYPPMVTTKADGTYKIGWFPGSYLVGFSTSGLNDGDPWTPALNFIEESYNPNEPIPLAAGSTVGGIDIRMTPGGVITGRVTDAGGNPLSGVHANIYDAMAINWYGTYTVVDGSFAADRMRTGNYKIRFMSRGPDYKISWFGDAASFDEASPVHVQAGQTTAGVDARLGLWPGGYIEGLVTNASGTPIPSAVVTAYDNVVIETTFKRVFPITILTARTDSGGRYRLGPLPPGSVKVGFAGGSDPGLAGEYHPDRLLFKEAESVPVTAGQTTFGIDAQLNTAGTISGRVTDGSGHPLSNVYIYAIDTGGDRFHSISTDAAGNYVLSRLPPDDYKVLICAFRGDYVSEWYDNQGAYPQGAVLTVSAGQTVSGVDAQLEEDGAVITGRVTNGAGAPIKYVDVTVRDSTNDVRYFAYAYTDASGNYRIRGVHAGDVKVQFITDWLYGHQPYQAEYYSNKSAFAIADLIATTRGQTITGINAVLDPYPALTISTTSLPSGEMAIPYEIDLQATGGKPFHCWSLESGALPAGLTLKSNGRITGVPAAVGTFDFTVRVLEATTDPQSDTQALRIVVGAYGGPGYLISGRVLAAGAVPVPGVALVGLPGNPVTDGSGNYLIAVLPGWSGTVTPILGGYAFDPPIRTYPTLTSDLSNQDYTAAGGITISGAVTMNGAAFPGVLMSGLPGNPRTDAAGFYTAAVPTGWVGTVTPTVPGVMFTPAQQTYSGVTSNQTSQNYTASYVGNADDAYEENNGPAAAAVIPLGTTTNLVLNDEDWFKFEVLPGDAGKDLKVRVYGLAYPGNPSERHDLDFAVLDQTGRTMSFNVSGSADEIVYLTNVAAGWYSIGQDFVGQPGTIYAITVEVGTGFGIGYISGRLTDDQGQGIANAYIELYGEPLDQNVSRPVITTDTEGNYKIGYLPGKYRLQFNITNNYHAVSYFPDVNFIGKQDSRLFTLVAGATISGIDATLQRGGTIAGLVRDPGGFPAPAFVYAYTSNNSAAGFSRTGGAYLLDRLPPGNYIVRVRPYDSTLAPQWFGGAYAPESSLIVPVRSGETTPDVNFQLGSLAEVEGFIEGRVTDASGNPIPGARVSTYHANGLSISGAVATADAAGNYFVRRIPPGPVKVQFSSPATSDYVTEFHPNQPQLADAVPVMVSAGQTVSGIDAQLALGGSVAGRVTDPGGAGLYLASVSVYDNNSARSYSASTDTAGNYLIRSVPPGSYKARFRTNPGAFLREWYNDQASSMTAEPVTVTAGGQVTNIDARLAAAPGGTISGRVTSSVDGSGIAGLIVSVRDEAKVAEIAAALTDADGYYSVLYVPTSQVKVGFLTDSLFLDHATEYYDDKLTFESADLVQATDGQTTGGIDAVLAPIPALAITTASLPAGQQFAPYSAVLQAQGGRLFYYWTLAPGSNPLPPGLSLTGKGEILGTPLAAGTYNLAITVTDSTCPQQLQSVSLTLNIGPSGSAGYTIDGYIWLNSAGGTPLPGVVLEGLPGPPATNLQGFYTTIVPPGFTGMARPVLSGYGFNPETDGYTNINVNRPRQDYIAYVVTLSGTTGQLPNGTTGQPYSHQLGATGGTSPYSWSLYAGALPDGLTLAADGTISGTPLRTGNYEFTARITDSGTPTQRVNQVFNITIGSGSVSGAILYSSNAAGSFDIWAMNEDGSNAHNLSTVSHDPSNLYTEYSGKWSPDGMRIAFTSNKSGVTALWIMEDDGRNDFKLTAGNFQEQDCAWSPDGSKLYYSRNTVCTTDDCGCLGCDYLEIYVYDLQAGTEVRLTDNLHREMCATVSPDGTRIAYVKDESPGTCCGLTDIWVMNADGSGQALLCGEPGAYDFGPIWGKADNKIYFSRHNWSTDYDIFSINPDGTGLARLTDNSDYDAVLAVSPDGSKIMFKSNRGGQSDLWIMDASGTILDQLTNDAAEEFYGDWAPYPGVTVLAESFESSPVGSAPGNWTVVNGGVAVAVSDARALEGIHSVYMRARPYGGANLTRSVSDLNITSGVYKLTFYMAVDPVNWTGTDGYAIGHLEIQGYSYAAGIKKDTGVYKLCLYGVSEKTFDFPGNVEAWNKYELIIDLDSKTTDLYFNGTYVDGNNIGNDGAPDRVHLGAGASGPGNGYPTVFYDNVTVERIR